MKSATELEMMVGKAGRPVCFNLLSVRDVARSWVDRSDSVRLVSALGEGEWGKVDWRDFGMLEDLLGA